MSVAGTVDIRTLLELNLALLRVRDYLFCGSPAIRQKWKEIRIRLALLFAILYQFEKRVSEQLTSLFMADLANEDMHQHIIQEIHAAESSATKCPFTGTTATIKTTDDIVGKWLDVLDNLIRDVYIREGYAYSYQQKIEQPVAEELTSSTDDIVSVDTST